MIEPKNDLGEQPPAVAATYLTGVTIRPPMDTLDAVFAKNALGTLADVELVTARADRYRRVADSISEALAHYDRRIGVTPAKPDPDEEMARYQRESR